MADFCMECSEKLFGEDFGDMKGLCSEGEEARVLCEGCGLIFVDHTGRRLISQKELEDERAKGWIKKDGRQ